MLLVRLLINFAHTIKLLYENICKKNIKPLKYSGKCYVILNGPSLKEEYNNIDFTDADAYVVNYFALTDYYVKIKPKGYFLCDPQFWKQSLVYERVVNLYDVIDKITDWDMNLYVSSHGYKQMLEIHNFKNPHINIIPVTTNVEYQGFNSLHNYIYANQLAMPTPYTVAIFAIYSAIINGYKHIELYGIDQSYFCGMFVNDDNELCFSYSHFYGEKGEVKKDVDLITGKVIKLSAEVESIAEIYRSHEKLDRLSRYLGVTIINRTKKSLLDSYIRGTQYENNRNTKRN